MFLLLTGCPDPIRNPAACHDGICIDPSLPFCDKDGTVFGQENTCVAIGCTPGDLQQCRGDQALTCNATGDNLEVVQCERGCDPGSGCRLCNPNETACTNGMLATCDASGAVVLAEPCALGCFEDKPRCRAVVPSNNLERFLDMVPDPPDLDLDGVTFDTRDGSVRKGATTIAVPNFLTVSEPGVPSIRVFVAKSIKLRGASSADSGDERSSVGPAIALLARGPIEISGTLTVTPRAGSAVTESDGCIAGIGTVFHDPLSRLVAAGGGGGGHATAGADGGAVDDSADFFDAAGGRKGVVTGASSLVPLRGGCTGGFFGSTPDEQYRSGGGAIQLTSGVSITVTGVIDVRGHDGFVGSFDGQNGTVVGGGGGGGGALLEAPSVILTGGRVLATGGAGGSACVSPTASCGVGGMGATRNTGATPGMGTTYSAAPLMNAGGGGGGLGRVRINSVTFHGGEVDAAVSNGPLATH
ncbi:MAG: hypothetical protein KIT31_25950 [Deltaproteobacteria bacterium]|nr:hypothetical protein [Deltaproteobacteria bacterium]